MTAETEETKTINFIRDYKAYIQTKPNPCMCFICEADSWARISKHLDIEIEREKIFRATHPQIPGGGFSPPSERKRRYEEVREQHKRGDFLV